MHIRLGSRKSHLAREQAETVKASLEALGHSVELHLRSSLGDLNLDLDLSKTQDKGVFTQDFNELLESREVDCVVHSWKDLPIEDSEKRMIVATLKREDTRDLFFIKKKALKKNKWTALTSSPRREFHLEKFFSFLSEGEIELNFKPIRGNIPTRISKFLDDEGADGFCIALAAIKRLLNNKVFNEEHPNIWNDVLRNCEWCVMPESMFPSAAAQGALAIEVLKENKDLIAVFNQLNHQSFKSEVELERKVLKDYGGGCHLSIGVTAMTKPQGKILIKSGEHEGHEFHSVKFQPVHAYPKKVNSSQIWFSKTQSQLMRSKLNYDSTKVTELDSVVVTRFEAFDESLKPLEVFASGVSTWKKIFKNKRRWVNGCLDSLGASSYPRDLFKRGINKHYWLTREGVEAPDGFSKLSTYKVNTEPFRTEDLDFDYYVWSSGQQMVDEILKNPVLKSKVHFVGLGRSYEFACKHLNELNLTEGLNFFTYYDLNQLLEDIVI